jgi:dipeptidyl-peptidase-4
VEPPDREQESSHSDSFPRQHARTQRGTLGEPKAWHLSHDGRCLAFLRSSADDDPVQNLWLYDTDSDQERLLVDARALDNSGELPPQEAARRERLREGAGGIVSITTDRSLERAGFALSGRLFVTEVHSGETRQLDVDGPIFDPKLDPTGQRIAYVYDAGLWVVELNGLATKLVNEPEVTWGLAEFVAAEEMNRTSGFWWSPNGQQMAVARVDTEAVPVWWISDAARPADQPKPSRYPAAGAANASVALAVIDLNGQRQMMDWDSEQFEYLVDVGWKDDNQLTVVLQSRDQRRLQYRVFDTRTGLSTEAFTDTDDRWVEIVPHGWGWMGERLVCCADRDDARRLLVDGAAVTPSTLQVRSISNIGADAIVFGANWRAEPSEQHVFRWTENGLVQLTHDRGVHTSVAGGSAVVVRSSTLDGPRATFQVLPGDRRIRSLAATPLVEPNIKMLRLGRRKLQAALLLPRGDTSGPLPVLMDPYGGPHALRAVASSPAHCSSQWFADQGFAVLVIDGRGTPGRGHQWERAIHHDLATFAVEDQIDGLLAAAEAEGQIDTSRVAIRGWSFGGYLAALAVLQRPDIFHAAIAGAPVTDWRLYDTHYTERYLGDPNLNPTPYHRTSLLTLAHTAAPPRPLMLIHGLADDNVFSAHTLQLSSALLAAGYPHSVLPLSGVTHMTPQEVVAENLLLLQVEFLRQSLGVQPT